jgi:hypothetical protein
MAEFTKLRTIASTNGGSISMASNHRRSRLPEGVFVMSREPVSKDGLPRIGTVKAANDSGSAYPLRAGGDRDHDDSPPPWWASLGSENRKVVNVWVLAVSAFYSLVMISLLTAVLLGAYTPEGRNAVAAAPGAERSVLPQASASTGNIGK